MKLAIVTIINLLCSAPTAYDDYDDDDANKSDWAIPRDSSDRSIFINDHICVAVLAFHASTQISFLRILNYNLLTYRRYCKDLESSLNKVTSDKPDGRGSDYGGCVDNFLFSTELTLLSEPIQHPVQRMPSNIVPLPKRLKREARTPRCRILVIFPIHRGIEKRLKGNDLFTRKISDSQSRGCTCYLLRARLLRCLLFEAKDGEDMFFRIVCWLSAD
jgi:hypothetical protein